MKKKNIIKQNYLENIPVRNTQIGWNADEKGIITLSVENRGIANKIAQKLFKKPRISYIHLDEIGSFVWPAIDGKKNITDIAKEVKEHFGESSEPLYERLAKYFQILKSYGFINFK